jgi:hypothetical protein
MQEEYSFSVVSSQGSLVRDGLAQYNGLTASTHRITIRGPSRAKGDRPLPLQQEGCVCHGQVGGGTASKRAYFY